MFALCVSYDEGRCTDFAFTFIFSYGGGTERNSDFATPFRRYLVEASAVPREVAWRISRYRDRKIHGPVTNVCCIQSSDGSSSSVTISERKFSEPYWGVC